MRRSVRARACCGHGRGSAACRRRRPSGPVEDFLDQLAQALAVAGVSGRTTVDRAASPTLVPGHMRRKAEASQVPDEAARVVCTVGTDRGQPRDGAFQHQWSWLAFGVPVGFSQFDIDD